MSDRIQPTEQAGQPAKQSFAMICLRYVLPAVVVIGGVVVMALGSESELEGGAGIAGAGLAIYAMNWLIRKASDDRERAQEEAARDYFDAHGHWPDEAAAHEPADVAPAPSRLPVTAPAATARRRLERNAIPRTRGSRGH
jgi:hypothetical protein